MPRNEGRESSMRPRVLVRDNSRRPARVLTAPQRQLHRGGAASKFLQRRRWSVSGFGFWALDFFILGAEFGNMSRYLPDVCCQRKGWAEMGYNRLTGASRV
jgi:hypothetical protein